MLLERLHHVENLHQLDQASPSHFNCDISPGIVNTDDKLSRLVFIRFSELLMRFYNYTFLKLQTGFRRESENSWFSK